MTDPESAASSLLASARNILANSDEDCARSTATIRSEVHAAASYAKKLVGAEGSTIDDAVALIDRGLDELEAQTAPQASALSVSAKLRQSYSLSIRTQEGDIVKISLRQRERLDGTQLNAADADGSAQVTELQLRSSTKLSLRIEGELSEAELSAIESVFDQAADIAEAFFAGDLATAAASTERFGFDSAQLAKIDLNLRTRFSASATYVSSTPTPQPDNGTPAESLPAADAALPAAKVSEATEQVATASDAPPASAPEGNAFASFEEFASALRSFFEAIVDGLDDLQTDQSVLPNVRYRYTAAFKTEALRMSLLAAAPADATETATRVADTIAEAATSTSA